MPARFPEARNAIERVRVLAQATSPVIVALDGRSGTGKSTLAEWMASQLGGIRVDQDDFYAGGKLHDWQRLTPPEAFDLVISRPVRP